MNIKEMIEANANITIAIKLEDLHEFGKSLILKTKEILEADLIEQKAEKYLTRFETCEYLNINQSTLFRWSKRDYLKPVEVGGRRLYKMSDLTRILNGGQK